MPSKPLLGEELLDSIFAFNGGMNAGLAPLLLPDNQLAYAENITVRGGFATHRPPHNLLRLSDAGRDLLASALANGRFQGAGEFTPEDGPGALNLTIVICIGGRLFQLILSDTPISVREIILPGSPTARSQNAGQVWMWQSELWLIVNDGISAPLFFDNFTARLSKYIQEDLGITADGGGGFSFTQPAIGETVTIPLQNPYLGPDNVVVTICGNQYEISKGPGLTTGFPVTVQNCGDHVGGAIAAGTELISDPAIVALTLSGVGECTPFGWAAPTQYRIGVGYNCGETEPLIGQTLDRPYLGNKGDQITIKGFPFIVEKAINVEPNSTSAPRPCGGSGSINPVPCWEYGIWFYDNTVSGAGGASLGQIPGCTPILRRLASTPPPTAIAKVATAFTPPAVGSSGTLMLEAPYQGELNRIVLINGRVYKITAVGESADPTPSVIGKNLNGTPGTTVAVDCHLLTIPELQPGRMGVYGLGRNWYGKVEPRKFRASDIVGSSSGTALYQYRDAVLKESSNTFLAEGGDFIVPGNIGPITAMRFTATLDASLGQGPLQVFTPTSVFSCNAPVDNTTWQDLTNPILTQSLIGIGAEGHSSTQVANGDIIFRSSVGLASLILARREFATWGNVPISREVEPEIASDQADLLNFGSQIISDNRTLMTAAPVESDFGVYHEKIVALNFDPISTLRGKEPSVYDGIWVDLNVFHLLSGRLENRERGFAVCFNTDTNQIELYEILKSTEADFDNGGERIVWEGQSSVQFKYPPNHPLSKTLKRLHDGEIQVDNLKGLVTFEFFYKPDQNPNWQSWFSWAVFSATGAAGSFRPRMGLGEPSATPCDTITNRPFREAYTFQIRWVITGHVRVLGALFKAVTIPQQMFAPQTCTAPTTPTLTLPSIDSSLCAGENYEDDLIITGLTEGNVTWEIVSGVLPPGIAFSGGTLPYNEEAILEGAATTGGVYTFTIGASYAGIYSERTYSLTVVEITSASLLPAAVLAVPYSYTLQQLPGRPEDVTWSLVVGSGALPPGLSLSAAGVLSGTPIGGAATWDFTLQAVVNILGVNYTCQKTFRVVVSASATESPALCIPELDEWSVPAGKFVDLYADSPSLPSIIQGNGNVLQMSGSCSPYRGEILSKSSFALAAGNSYKLSVRIAGNGKSATLPQDGFAHDTCNLEIHLTNSVFQYVLTVDRLAAFAWHVFDGITVTGPTTVQIRIVSLDPVGPVFSPTPNSSGYGAYIKEVKLENVTTATTLFNDAF